MSIYWQLLRLTVQLRRRGYLRHYKNDLLVHDKASLAKVAQGTQLLWLIRPCGTQLYTVRGGWNAVWLTYWLDPVANSRECPHKVFLIEVTGMAAAAGKIREISYDRARQLAALPNLDGVKYSFNFATMTVAETRNGIRVPLAA